MGGGVPVDADCFTSLPTNMFYILSYVEWSIEPKHTVRFSSPDEEGGGGRERESAGDLTEATRQSSYPSTGQRMLVTSMRVLSLP